MPSDSESIRAAIDVHARHRRRRDRRAASDRLADFAKLQQASFDVLCASPAGFSHFLRRNFHSRRVEAIDGQWQPVSLARRSYPP
jgi:hypothetical protein